MKINQNYNDPRAQGLDKAQETAAAQQARNARNAGGAGGAGEDQISLSHLAGALQEALESSPERVAEIEKLAADYAAGRLEVDSAEAARAIVEDALRPKDF
jgi:anti-sigma28 factor (negative regulator of flagellin synthesis)